MVHQHFMLVPNLTAVENAVLGLPSRRPPLLDLEAARARLTELSADYQLDVDPLAPVWQLPVGAQQRLEILKALFREARVLVLDEPTAVLAPAEVDQLFRIVRLLASQERGSSSSATNWRKSRRSATGSPCCAPGEWWARCRRPRRARVTWRR